jgi:uncharacterized protein DUF6011
MSVQQETFIEFLPKIIDKIRPGYYAVRRDGGMSADIDFFRVSTPDAGNYRGTYKVQTQHSDHLLNALIVWPEGHWKVKRDEDGNRRRDLEGRTEVLRPYIRRVMLDALPNLFDAALLYAVAKNRCWRCNAALTDADSRFYSIGPECRGKADWFYMEQIMRKGFFEHSEVDL